jgi:hypothetical protein
MTSPWDRCAVATCPHASAPNASQPNRRHPLDENHPEAPTNTNGVHPSVPANGRLIATLDAAIAIASENPPIVAAMPDALLAQEPQSPSLARSGSR